MAAIVFDIAAEPCGFGDGSGRESGGCCLKGGRLALFFRIWHCGGWTYRRVTLTIESVEQSKRVNGKAILYLLHSWKTKASALDVEVEKNKNSKMSGSQVGFDLATGTCQACAPVIGPCLHHIAQKGKCGYA